MRVVVFALGAALSLGAGMVACNSLLGIDEASLSSADASSFDAGTDYHLNCDTYCAVMAAACKDNNAEYINREVCLALCAQFATDESNVSNGMIDKVKDPSSNPQTADTLNCRLWHANFAIIVPDSHTHCPHAGPLGGTKCGDPCRAFCTLDTYACSGKFAAYEGGINECLTACGLDAGGFGATYSPSDPEAKGIVSSNVGNTLTCRMYHLEAALDPNGLGKAVHCMHTSLTSTPDTCGAPARDN